MPSMFGMSSTLTLILGILIPLLVPSLILIPPLWKLCGRAGFPRWFSFAMVIPLANVTLLYFVAFSQWPSELRDKGRRDEADFSPGKEAPIAGRITRPMTEP